MFICHTNKSSLINLFKDIDVKKTIIQKSTSHKLWYQFLLTIEIYS